MALPLHHVAFHHPNELLEDSDTETPCRYSPKTRTEAAIILNKKLVVEHRIMRIFKCQDQRFTYTLLFATRCCVETQPAVCTAPGAEGLSSRTFLWLKIIDIQFTTGVLIVLSPTRKRAP